VSTLNKMLATRVDPATFERLALIADADGLTMYEVARRVIERGLPRLERERAERKKEQEMAEKGKVQA